ncbi:MULTISPECIES: hypothetical protein [unclassified Rhizobium]|jgi:hypothetical protein|uniref:hypothetical protein n=1 Tax=unclassified Rhizobium TaxID=2613769 RepID=UPI00064748DD|nr:hypothetical protein [Rhizobium sp. UBA1881]
MGTADWIAIYAAIVATGALSLEIRRWFESGPKISITANPGMSIIGAGGLEAEDLLVVKATNRGDAPTTITHLCLLEYSNTLQRWRDKASKQFVILHPQLPGYPSVIPYVLKVGEQWTGIGHDRTDVTGDVQSGNMWAGIYTTDRRRPYLVRIKKRETEAKLADAQEI